MKSLTSVTFRIKRHKGRGAGVTELHNGLWRRSLASWPPQAPAIHIEDYVLDGERFTVELKITPHVSGERDGK